MVAPLIVLLILGGIDLARATERHAEVGHLARVIVTGQLHEDEAGSLADAHEATLECFDVSSDGACYADGLDPSTVRYQAVVRAEFDGVLFDLTVRGKAAAVDQLGGGGS